MNETLEFLVRPRCCGFVRAVFVEQLGVPLPRTLVAGGRRLWAATGKNQLVRGAHRRNFGLGARRFDWFYWENTAVSVC